MTDVVLYRLGWAALMPPILFFFENKAHVKQH